MLKFLLLFALVSPSPVPDKNRLIAKPIVEKLDGIYLCRGQDTKGKSYSGATTIRKVGDVYLFNWTTVAESEGIGLRTGDSISVGWSTGRGRGISVYRIEEGPRLVGRWASVPGVSHTCFESLEFLRAFPDDEDE